MLPTIGHMTRLIIMLLAASFDLNAQSIRPTYNFKHLNVQNGLTQNVVYRFLQDSHGYMWIGTHNGLTMYDGITTTNFLQNEQDSTSITGNFISSILEDSSQQVWIGNENGIDRYNRSDHSFSHFGVDRPDGSKDNTYCVLLGFVTANNLWFLDTKTKSIRTLNTKSKKTSFIAELKSTHAILYKGSEQTVHVWSAYDVGTIHQVYRNDKLIRQFEYFTGKTSSARLEVNHVLQQNDSTAWIASNQGLVKLNPLNHQYYFFNKGKNQDVRELRYAALSPKGQLWLGSGPAGVHIFDLVSGQFINNLKNDKSDPLSICSDNIVSLYFDNTGNIWCGSYGNGTSYASTENDFFTTHLSVAEVQTWKGINNISWLKSDRRRNLWCMMNHAPGFWILGNDLKIKSHRIPVLENGIQYNNAIVKIVFVDDNFAWCATQKGLFRYNISFNQMVPVPYDLLSEEIQGSIWIKDIILAHDSSLVFSTYVGLYRVKAESGKHIVKPLNFLKPGAYLGFGPLFQDAAKNLYVKSLGDTMYVLKPSGMNEFELIHSIRFTPEVNQYFTGKADSIIYMATNDGVYHLNNNTFRIRKESFNNKLPFTNINSAFKHNDQFWFFGEKGLYYFDEANQQGRTYTVDDGLPTNEFKLSSLVHTGDRHIAGTSNGLVSFFPTKTQDSIYPPRPRITNIYVNDTLARHFRNPDEASKIILSHKENTFSFDFAPIAFQHAEQCSFEFKLEGYDDSWVKTDVAKYTRYSKIPPGNYFFHLRALDAMGRISPFTKTVEIEIARAFWQTTLFKIFVVALSLFLGWLLIKLYFRNRIRQQKLEFGKQQAIERERTRIATDMHDDLGAGLSRIKFLSQALNNKKSEDESLKTGLGKIIDFSDEMTEKMGEIVWALNEKNDTLADLVAYTRSYAMEYLANHNIACKMDTPMHLPDTFIAGEIRRNIFLTVKECLHNIIKHAGATQVNFTIQLNHSIEVIIHDNGKGIDWNNQRSFSNGLQNIEKRMKDIHGKAIFVNDHGTRVMLHIPVTL